MDRLKCIFCSICVILKLIYQRESVSTPGSMARYIVLGRYVTAFA